MGVYAPALQWIPEDDILLKNAMEAGASFESLAKGAVPFSRRFSVKEVRERWQLILYDPFVSTEASDLMLQLTPSKASKNGHAKENILPEKRKSVRHSYYAMRKRILKEPFINSMDLSFLEDNNCIGALGDPISDHIGFDQTNLELMHHSFSQNLIRGAGAYSIENNFPAGQNGIQEPLVSQIYKASELDHVNGDSRNLCAEYGGAQVYTSPISDCGRTFHNLDYSSPFSEPSIWKTMEGISAPDLSIDIIGMAEKHQCRRDEFTLPGDDINTATSEFDLGDSDSRLKDPNLCTNGFLKELFDVLTNDEVDEEVILDNTYYDGLSSLLLESPSKTNHDHIPSETQCEILLDTYHANTREANDNMGPVHVDGNTSVLSEIHVILPIYSEHPEIRDGVICCVLNTEDTEIPDNDDIFLSNNVSSISVEPLKGYTEPPSSSFPSTNVFVGNKRNNEIVPGSMNKQGKNVGQTKGSSASGLGVLNKVNTTSEKAPATKENLQDEERGSMDLLVEEVEANLCTSDQEDSSFEDDNVPCFSDVEAMILDMDLGPDEKDAHLNEVSKYRNDDMKRKIIRLEQSTHACLQREIASHGAFALLYGRHSKHYIRKTKVILGRATEDIVVDIDLGRERHGNRISRRQALITMDDAGNFHLKNLGKCSIFVNDKEITSKDCRILTSGCLIEIREIPFIFQTNERFVKEYMDSISTCER